MSDIFDCYREQAALPKHIFVVCQRCEQVKAHTGAFFDLLVRQRTGHDSRIGEQQSARWLEQPRPIRDNTLPVGEMIDRIDAYHCIQAAGKDWPRLCRVLYTEFCNSTQAAFRNEQVGRRDRSAMNIDAQN